MRPSERPSPSDAERLPSPLGIPPLYPGTARRALGKGRGRMANLRLAKWPVEPSPLARGPRGVILCRDPRKRLGWRGAGCVDSPSLGRWDSALGWPSSPQRGHPKRQHVHQDHARARLLAQHEDLLAWMVFSTTASSTRMRGHHLPEHGWDEILRTEQPHVGPVVRIPENEIDLRR
jgi:hypothetical protein